MSAGSGLSNRSASPVAGMLETEDRGVQGLAARGPRGPPAARLGEAVGLGLEAGPVERVAEQRVADMGHVDADLMRPPGLELAAHEARERLGAAAAAPPRPHSG